MGKKEKNNTAKDRNIPPGLSKRLIGRGGTAAELISILTTEIT